jgi:DNA-binding winged helix-turn-helix (wHTH) protein
LDRLCLEGGTGVVVLRPKSFDVLCYLVENAGRVVTKGELIGAVWPDVTVSDESLTQCISEVRRAIGDADKHIIKTVPRRGYLVETLQPTDNGLGPMLQVPSAGAATSSPLQVSGEDDVANNAAPAVVQQGELPKVATITRLSATIARLAKPLALFAVGIALIGGTIAANTRWRTYSVDGTLHGAMLCEKLPYTDKPLVTDIAVRLAGSSATYARDIYSPDHAQIIGLEEGTGTVSRDGALRLTGGWSLGPTMHYTASYSGTVADRTADLRGTQDWKLDGQDFARHCTIKLFP